jgi:hypothetical protein
MFQEERLLLYEVIVQVILRKKRKIYIYICPVPNGKPPTYSYFTVYNFFNLYR